MTPEPGGAPYVPRRVAEEPLRLLFVCTANISRSPYAERRARQALGDAPVVVASAGVPGFPDRGMDPAMAALLGELGVDAMGHCSRRVTSALLADADLVLTFEFAQRMRLFDDHAGHAGRILGLRQFVAALDAVERAEGPGSAGQGSAGQGTLAGPGISGRELIRRAARLAPPDSMSLDVADPYNRGPRAARACALQIDEALNRILPALVPGAAPLEPLANDSVPGSSTRWTDLGRLFGRRG